VIGYGLASLHRIRQRAVGPPPLPRPDHNDNPL